MKWVIKRPHLNIHVHGIHILTPKIINRFFFSVCAIKKVLEFERVWVRFTSLTHKPFERYVRKVLCEVRKVLFTYSMINDHNRWIPWRIWLTHVLACTYSKLTILGPKMVCEVGFCDYFFLEIIAKCVNFISLKSIVGPKISETSDQHTKKCQKLSLLAAILRQHIKFSRFWLCRFAIWIFFIE